MKEQFGWLICWLSLATCVGSLRASASELFSDLGPPGNQYDCCVSWAVSGSNSLGGSVTAANLFAVGGSGTFNVTQVDLGVGFLAAPPTFYASIWTDDGGLPGHQVAGAFWNDLVTITRLGFCPPTCPGSYDGGGFVTISGIAGVTLVGGQSYFMILGPVDFSDSSHNGWNWNTQGISGLDLYSTNGGMTWNINNDFPLAAFDVLGQQSTTPEPSSLLLLGTGILGTLETIRRLRVKGGATDVPSRLACRRSWG